jgi:dihydroorotase
MTGVVYREGRVIDPVSGFDGTADVAIFEGKIEGIGPGLKARPGAVEHPAKGLWILPGLVDLRCQVNTPKDLGDALRGGYTTLVSTWDSELSTDVIRVLRAAPLTREAAGEELGDVPPGAPCLSDGFTPVTKAGLMRRALQYVRPLNAVLMVHAEDRTLSGKGVLGEGFEATRLGLLPVPTSAETVAIARDLMLLEEIGGRVHFSHVTCAGSVRLIRDAKARGLAVTADVAVHHITLCDEDARGYAPKARIWPPLRPAAERQALRDALAEGVIDAVASDHLRPDPSEDLLQRELPFDEQKPGGASLSRVLSSVLSLGLKPLRAVELLTSGPARVLGLDAGALTVGGRADVTLWNAERRTVDHVISLGNKS